MLKRHHAWGILVGLLAALALTGCGGGKVITPFWYKLTDAERVEVGMIEAAVARLCEQQRAQQLECRPPVIGVQERAKNVGRHWSNNNSIELPRTVLQGRGWRALVAHELAHWWKGHGPQRCASDQAACEREANAVAVGVLKVGFQMSHREAVATMWSMLKGQIGAAPMRGHPNWCTELNDFEQRVGLRYRPARGSWE